MSEPSLSIAPSPPEPPPAVAERRCPNCATPATGNFCAECGQRQGRLRLTVKELLRDVAGDIFHVDSKVARTAVALVARPGLLTVEYLHGRRDRYVRPFKVYLIASIAYFSALAVHPPTGAVRVSSDEGSHVGLSVGVTKPEEPGAPKLQASLEGDAEDPISAALSRRLKERGPEGVKQEIFHALTTQVPRAMFGLLPVFAALTWLAFRKARLFYVEHFIFALHLHSLAFLAFTVGRYAPFSSVVDAVMELAAVVYVFLAARRVFGLGVVGTLWRGTLVGAIYLVAIGLALTAVVIGSLLLT